MLCGTAPEAGRIGLPRSLYWLLRSSLQGGNSWVGGLGAGRRCTGDRLRLVTEIVGFEPTGPLRPRQAGGPPECKSDALSRSATSPAPSRSSPPGVAGAGFLVSECPNITHTLYLVNLEKRTCV